MSETLKDLSVLWAKKQPKQVDYITEDAPILKIIPFEESSHEFSNVYERLDSVTGASFVEMNAVLPSLSAKSKLEKLDLGIMGGEAEVYEDTAKAYGGPAKYFAKKEPSYMRQTGSNAEKQIMFNNFLAYALANAKALKTTASSGNGYSIVAVRFVPGETTGLYSPVGFKQGTMLEAMPINGGSIYKNSEGKLVYGIRYKGYFGLQIANPNSVAAICNIQSDKLPTETQINDLLDLVRANNSSTYMFCNPKVLAYLSSMKLSKIVYTNQDKGINLKIVEFNGVPFVTSYNMEIEAFHTIS